MELTKSQEKEMRRVFPNGWEEIDIPTFWRNEYFENEMRQAEADERALEDLEREEFFNNQK